MFLLDPASSFLRPKGAPGRWEGEPQSYTSRRVRHCLGSLFWSRWQQVLLGLLWVSLLRLGSRVGWGDSSTVRELFISDTDIHSSVYVYADMHQLMKIFKLKEFAFLSNFN